MADITLEGSGLNANIAPFAFQFYAKDFYEAYQKHKGGRRFSPARLFLLGRSIELAAKSLHLARARTIKDLTGISHDLIAACDSNVLAGFNIELSTVEEAELKKANRYYEHKGFEYFWFKFPGLKPDRSGPQLALSGWRELPDESILEELLKRLLSPEL